MAVETGAGEEDPKAETAGFAPKALAPDENVGVLVDAAGEASFGALEEAVSDVASSLLAAEADPKPKLVEPKGDAGLPLPAALLNAPKPKPLDGFEAAPNAGEEDEAVDVDPKAGDWPKAGKAEEPKADLEPKADD